jgi:hypothetical protein
MIAADQESVDACATPARVPPQAIELAPTAGCVRCPGREGPGDQRVRLTPVDGPGRHRRPQGGPVHQRAGGAGPAATGWRRRLRSSSVPRPTSPGERAPEIGFPAGPGAGRRRLRRRGDLPGEGVTVGLQRVRRPLLVTSDLADAYLANTIVHIHAISGCSYGSDAGARRAAARDGHPRPPPG